jgi:hypothetical protein
MNDIDYHQVIKWVLIVLAAGFIGHFGKSFAAYLIARARRNQTLADEKKSEVLAKQPGEITSSTAAAETAGTRAKSEKKAMKALIKLKKKEK